jgi:hypothetical protein
MLAAGHKSQYPESSLKMVISGKLPSVEELKNYFSKLSR